MAFVANIGTPDTAQAPNAYAPPPVSGVYKVRIGEAKMTPVKSAPEVTMLRIPVRAIATVDGQKASGFAESLIFNIPAEHAATYGEKYNLAAQQGPIAADHRGHLVGRLVDELHPEGPGAEFHDAPVTLEQA